MTKEQEDELLDDAERKPAKSYASRTARSNADSVRVQRVGRHAAWQVAGEGRRHPDCKCDKVILGFATRLISPGAPKGGLPGNECKCGLTWVALNGKTWWRKGRVPTE
jgi:hypothetical protein